VHGADPHGASVTAVFGAGGAGAAGGVGGGRGQMLRRGGAQQAAGEARLGCESRVRVEITGSQKCRIVGESQSVRIMIYPMISTRTRRSSACGVRGSVRLPARSTSCASLYDGGAGVCARCTSPTIRLWCSGVVCPGCCAGYRWARSKAWGARCVRAPSAHRHGWEVGCRDGGHIPCCTAAASQIVAAQVLALTTGVCVCVCVCVCV
jgi:hypothetical protein